jgi:hypothetical protein
MIALVALAAAAEPAAPPERVAKHQAVFTAPPRGVPTNGMPDGPLLGNGDVGIVLAGTPDAQRFYIGKNDFWTNFQGDPNTTVQSKIITVGRLELEIPALQGASYRQEQDLAKAEVRGTFTKDGLTVRTRSWVDANENLLLTQLQCEGAPVAFKLQAFNGAAMGQVPARVADAGNLNIGREQYGAGRWYFNGEIADVVVTDAVLDGKAAGQPQKPEAFDGKATWHPLAVPKMGKSVSVAAWIKIADTSIEANYIASKGEWSRAYSLGLSNGCLRWTINGVMLQTEKPLEKGKWLYVAGTFDGRRMCMYVDGVLQAALGGGSGSNEFTRKADPPAVPGREVAVAARAIGAAGLEGTLKPGETVTLATAILSDLDARETLAAARKLVAGLTPKKIDKLTDRHRAWWTAFWARSFIEIPDQEIEKRWYAALYTMASCSRPGKVAPGLWGNWLTTDTPDWQGDFHLNYNFQAPFYMVYASNHADVSLPFYQAIKEAMPAAREMSKRHGWKGVHFPCGIGPWGRFGYSREMDHGQRSNSAYVALNYIWYWQYTQDKEWLRTDGYPYLREVAAFWDDYLKLEDGRYVIYKDAIHEGSGSDMNPILSLGLVRTLFKNVVEMSRELGVDADKQAKWQDIVAKMSGYTMQERGGKTVFRYSEKGLDWYPSNTLGIQHIFPAGDLGLDSDPKLLEISRDTITVLNRWADYNGFSSFYTAAARIGYDPNVILAKLRAECDKHSMPNLLLTYGGGGIESGGGFLAINEMLLQSHEGIIRLFPCWPHDKDARFGTLRAVGAFLVSAELKAGIISGMKIVSEKGRDCTIQNPWPGKKIQVVRNGKKKEIVEGGRFTVKTKPGETLELKAE